jgi:hypothetical protein
MVFERCGILEIDKHNMNMMVGEIEMRFGEERLLLR